MMKRIQAECQLLSEKYLSENNMAVFLCCMILGFPILELICVPLYYPFLLQEQFLVFCGLMFLLFSIIKWVGGTNHRLCLSDGLLIASAVFAVISIVTSLNIHQSLTGQPDYSETPLQTLGYFMSFLISTRIEKDSNKKKVLYAFGGMFVMEMIVGTLQKLELWPWAAIWGQSRITSPGIAYGLTENSNFYGGICVLAVGFFMGLYLLGNVKTKLHSTIMYLLAVWAFLCALFSNARLAWVGIAGSAALITFLDILMRKKYQSRLCNPKRKWFLFISFSVIFLLMYFFDPVMSARRAEIQNDMTTIQAMLSGENGENIVNGLGSSRGYIWRVCIHAWLQRPFLGVGFDNLRYAFTMFSDPSMHGISQGKAHNEYLHYLTTQGLFSCLNYLCLCGYVVIRGIKNGISRLRNSRRSDEHISWTIQFMLLIMIFGYFSQALFNSSVTNIAVYKWIIMGLCLPKSEQKEIRAIRLIPHSE